MNIFQNAAVITVDFKPLIDSIEEGAGADGLTAKVDYLVAWSDRFTFANQAMGLSTLAGSTLSGAWLQNLPFQYPASKNLFLRSLRMVGEGQPIPNPNPNVQPTYSHARIQCNFGTRQFSDTQAQDPLNLNSFGITPDEQGALLWSTQEIDYGHEFLPVPSTNLKWSSDSTSVSQPVSRKVAVQTMSIAFERFPFLPTAILQSYADAVNWNTFLGCAPGTVYFVGGKTRREFNQDGSVTQKLVMNFKFRSQDWNKMLKSTGADSSPTTPSWDYVIDPTNSNSRLFFYMDFLQLLRFQTSGIHVTPGT